MDYQEGRQPLLSMKNIGKAFSGVTVLSNVNLDLYPGEVCVLAGEMAQEKAR